MSVLSPLTLKATLEKRQLINGQYRKGWLEDWRFNVILDQIRIQDTLSQNTMKQKIREREKKSLHFSFSFSYNFHFSAMLVGENKQTNKQQPRETDPKI